MTKPEDETAERYYTTFAAAYVRGTLPEARDLDDAAALAFGHEAGLRLHRFKRTMDLPRVRAVLGILQGLQPESLLDIGTGRGVFLWPLLDGFPALEVTATDILDGRIELLAAVRAGGLDRLHIHKAEAAQLPFDADCFDVTTALEVLEHMEAPASAVRELIRVTRRFVVASVPSKEDDNPEHIQLFDKATFENLFTQAGARSANVTYVRGHMICVAAL